MSFLKQKDEQCGMNRRKIGRKTGTWKTSLKMRINIFMLTKG